MTRFLLPVTAALSFWAAVAVADERQPGDVDLTSDFVLMGELHDNPDHHANQSDWVARQAPAALVFEMLTPEQATTANELRGAAMSDLADALDWADSGWPDFAWYHPIFTAAPEALIFGAGVGRDDLRAAMEADAATVFGADAERFLLDLPLPLEERAIREDEQAQAHCGALPDDLLPAMVEAQRLRDATLARTAIEAFDLIGGPVAIITGNGHARTDWGVPSYLRAARPDLSVTSIGQLTEAEASPPYDMWVIVPYARTDRPDPCAAFR